jgi:hypothetical protein
VIPSPFFAPRRFAFGLLRSQRVWRSTSRAHPEHAQCRSPSPTKKKLGRSVLAFRSGPASFRPARRRRCAGTLLVEMPSPPWGDQARGPSTSRFYRGRGMTRLVLKNGGIRPPRCEQREHHGRGRDYRFVERSGFFACGPALGPLDESATGGRDAPPTTAAGMRAVIEYLVELDGHEDYLPTLLRSSIRQMEPCREPLVIVCLGEGP